MKQFCFTIDDNIRFLKELSRQGMGSLFEHPYLAMLGRLHQRFGLKVQLNLFYRTEGFDLSQVNERYRKEWEAHADWLKLSFHSEWENVRPYAKSGYDAVFQDCSAVHQQILRFASSASLGETTTVHYCQTTSEGVKALADNGVKGLLGLFGTTENPGTSYSLGPAEASRIRAGETLLVNGMAFAAIDMVINSVKLEQIVPRLTALLSRGAIHVMIHEQYFYEDYRAYQPDFEEKLITVFELLCDNGYQSSFFEKMI